MCIADKKHIRLRQNSRLLQQLCDQFRAYARGITGDYT
jgi:hypothetical protein